MPRARYRRDVWDHERPGNAIHVGGRKFVLRGKADFAARGFLIGVDEAISQSRSGDARPLRLITLRTEFREIMRDAPVAGLVSCLSLSSREPVVQCLALWLLGHCHAKRAIPAVALFCRDPDDAVRKEAVRALHRLGAWAELRSIGAEPNPKIERFLNPPARRPFGERMARFAGTVAPNKSSASNHKRSRMALFWAVLPGRGRPPKSAEYIRLILERIRALLRRPL